MFRAIYLLFVRTLAFALGPLHFLWGPLTKVLVWVGGFYLLFSLFISDDPIITSTESQDPTMRVVQGVEYQEDGNSKFSRDLLPQMRTDELSYYFHIFKEVMQKVHDGEAYAWNYHNIHGTLTPTRTFTNGSGEQCREFTELLKVHDTQQTLDGVSCYDQVKRKWCKLRQGATPTCKITAESGWDRSMRNIGRSINNLF